VTVNPCATLRLPGPDEDRVKALDEAQLAVLIAATPLGRDRLVIEFMAASELRTSEALGLRWEDLDLREAVVSVNAQIQRGARTRTKTRTGERLVKLPVGLVAQLRGHRLASPHSKDGDGIRYSHRPSAVAAQRLPDDYAPSGPRGPARVGVAHTLRHSNARRLLVVGVGFAYLRPCSGTRTPPSRSAATLASFPRTCGRWCPRPWDGGPGRRGLTLGPRAARVRG
jgi:integrase